MTREPHAAWDELNARIECCTTCQRLTAHCKRIATEKKAAYRAWDYWGKPVPNFGDPAGRLLIVGLAPGTHGSNRTGRMFTGDASGEWLYRAMYRAGFATQPHARDRADGLMLVDCTITAVGHCAPPQNKLERGEMENCRPFLDSIFNLMPARVFLALGGVAWREMFRLFRVRGWHAGSTPAFRHGASQTLSEGRWAVGSYHPSRQNTNTGRLTEAMLDEVFGATRRLVQSCAS